MNFLKSFLASILGTIVFYFYRIIYHDEHCEIATAISSEDTVVKEIKENSVLELDLNLQMCDNIGETQELEVALGLGRSLKFYDVVAAIKKATTNDIKGINLNAQFPLMGWSKPKAFAKPYKSLRRLEIIYNYGDYYGQKGYASFSFRSFCSSYGRMEFEAAAEVLYYKDFQDKYGFKMRLFVKNL